MREKQNLSPILFRKAIRLRLKLIAVLDCTLSPRGYGSEWTTSWMLWRSLTFIPFTETNFSLAQE